MFFAMPAIMTARLHALPHPHFQAQTNTPARILSLIIIPGNTEDGTVEHRGIYRWPLPRSSYTWEVTDGPWQHAGEGSLPLITSADAGSNVPGQLSYPDALTEKGLSPPQAVGS
jgi:hypothetical protein